MPLTIVVPLLFVAVLLGYRIAKGTRRRVIWESKPRVPAPGPGSPGRAVDDPELLAAVKRGDKLTAIKRHRELTGVGLRESRDTIEARIRLMD